MLKQDGYMVIDLMTAECETGFNTYEDAQAFIEKIGIPHISQDEYDSIDFDYGETERTLIMPYKHNDTLEEDELTLYDNSNKERPFSKVAEYYEDTLNDDFISTPFTPIRLTEV